MKAEKIPHYVDPSTFKSKRAKNIARVSDFVWWLMKHNNYVVDVGFEFPDGGICGSCFLKMRYDHSFKTHEEVVSDCQCRLESIIKMHGRLLVQPVPLVPLNEALVGLVSDRFTGMV